MNNTEVFIILGVAIGGFVSLIVIISMIKNYYWPKKNESSNKVQINLHERKVTDELKFWSRKNRAMYLEHGFYALQGDEIDKINGVIIAPKVICLINQTIVDGNVFGQFNSKTLTIQTEGQEDEQIPNPIIQNDIIIEKLQKVMLTNVPIVSLIIFVGSVNTISIENPPDHVILTKTEDLFVSLKEMQIALEEFPIIEKSQRDTIFYNITSHLIKDRKTRKAIQMQEAAKVQSFHKVDVKKEITKLTPKQAVETK